MGLHKSIKKSEKTIKALREILLIKLFDLLRKERGLPPEKQSDGQEIHKIGEMQRDLDYVLIGGSYDCVFNEEITKWLKGDTQSYILDALLSEGENSRPINLSEWLPDFYKTLDDIAKNINRLFKRRN